MLPLQAKVNLEAMAIKGDTAFSRAPALPGPHHQIVLCHIRTLAGRVSVLCRNAISVFYCPSRLVHSLEVVLLLCRDAVSIFYCPSRLVHSLEVVLLLCRDAVSVFYCPNRLGHRLFNVISRTLARGVI